MDFQAILNWIKEPSTWRGATALAGLIGVKLQPDLQGEIIAICIAIYGGIQLFRRENK